MTLSRYPITPYRTGHRLHDPDGRIVSFHRTVSGALRARARMIAEEYECAACGNRDYGGWNCLQCGEPL